MSTIGDYAFKGCGELLCIYYCGESQPELGLDVFANTTIESVFVLESFNGTLFGTFEIKRGFGVCTAKPKEPNSGFIISLICEIAAVVIVVVLVIIVIKSRRGKCCGRKGHFRSLYEMGFDEKYLLNQLFKEDESREGVEEPQKMFNDDDDDLTYTK